MIGSLQSWLLQGSFELEVEKLEVAPLEGQPADLFSAASGALRDLQAQVALFQAAAERRRAIEAAGTHPPKGGDDQEFRQMARSLLPSLDALDRIIELGEAQASTDEKFANWHGSIKALRTRVTKVLEGIGLTALSTVGTEVDLEIHDVVSIVPAGQHPANSIVSEQQKGYYFRGKLLRDAKVVVAQ